MALKPYSELVKIDVGPYCDVRDAKDDNGRKISVPYLNWAKCKELLHQNGAESVYYTPLTNDDGSFLFTSRIVQNKERTTGCYFVAVDIHIDEKTYRMDMPLMNGANVVYDDSLNQLRVSNCHARAFVKGVAIHTGLGFSLWCSDMDTDSNADDAIRQNIMLYKQWLTELMTSKIQKGVEIKDVLRDMGVKATMTKSEEEILSNRLACLDWVYKLEQALLKA